MTLNSDRLAGACQAFCGLVVIWWLQRDCCAGGITFMDNTDDNVDASRAPPTGPVVVPDLADVAGQLVAPARANGVN